MSSNKVLNLLGLAARAGKIASGEFSVDKALNGKKAALIVLAEDASENTRKHFTDKAVFHQIDMIVLSTKDELGHAVGRGSRSCLSVNDSGFAAAVIKEYQRSFPQSGENNGEK